METKYEVSQQMRDMHMSYNHENDAYPFHDIKRTIPLIHLTVFHESAEHIWFASP